MSGPWFPLARRVLRESEEAALKVSILLEVRCILDECVSDIEEAARLNANAKLKHDLDIAKIESEAARFAAADAGERCAAFARERRLVASGAAKLRGDVVRDVVALRRLRATDGAAAAAAAANELEARRVPGLEAELRQCRRDAASAQKRAALAEAPRHEPTALEAAKRRTSGLVALEDKLLLKVFSFLSAWGVLACAQGDRAFFARVDVLFGMGSNVAHNVAAAAGPLANLFAPRGGKSKAKAVLSAATASAISGKLNATEIKGIIALDERARRLEAECFAQRAEQEDLAAALESTESVKDFLALKLRETEALLSEALEFQAETARQQHSDHEVISYLDSRVRELEAECSAATARRESVELTLRNERDAALSELRSADETRSVERAHGDSAAAAAKQQKKLLVREVKTLRTQLAAVLHVASRATSATGIA
ncbi:hypothetical protein M885DRAFT_528239 [Pelagophyceae sp. CCMP2097]|nr:hypothetical protein M885DRAFT_528239 [Pelagophyceae sp. CCMP2097]